MIHHSLRMLALFLVALGSTTLTTEAFVPSAAKPRTTPLTLPPSGTFGGAPLVVSCAAGGGSTTALAMGQGHLMDRFFRVARSNLHTAVSSLEHPETIIGQAVRDMQSDLIKVRQAYAAATASQRRLQREKDQVEAVASNWYNRAQLALKSSHEGLAREALARRQAALAKADTLQGQMDRQGVAVEKLYVAMHALEAKIREAASTKEQLIARARTAQTTLQVNDMLSGLTGKTAVDAFDRMAKKVEALEAVAEASGEMNLLPLGKAESSLEADFLLLEQSSAVDQELKRMKSNMSETRMLGAATSTEGELRKPVRIPVTQGEKLYIR